MNYFRYCLVDLVLGNVTAVGLPPMQRGAGWATRHAGRALPARQSGVGTPSGQSRRVRACYSPLTASPNSAQMNRSLDDLDLTRNSILRITDKKTLQLVLEIRKYDCLWNTHLEDYPNRVKRAKAAERIAKVLNVPHFEPKHVLIKLKNLRNSYCQELKKIGISIEKTGSEDSPDTYRPKVQWFAIMDSFMRPHLQSKTAILVNRKRFDDVKVKMECEDSNHSGQEDWSLQQSESGAQETNHSCGASDDGSADGQPSKRRRLSESCDQTNLDTNNDLEQTYPNVSNITNNVLGVPQLPQREDVFDTFGKYVASLLRCLPKNEAFRLQPEIIEKIVQVKMNGAMKVENLQTLENPETLDKVDSSSAHDSE
ncbi:unnamed protein product [Chrysodeixis includens]|uniref:MADF domain-containing protein n=1 Tax=Chrysodeixis includens TaxID=689277 RepID=A0A9P0BQV7_CHRIL|nr:unnamed protein product [Chrysodeixis includens]